MPTGFSFSYGHGHGTDLDVDFRRDRIPVFDEYASVADETKNCFVKETAHQCTCNLFRTDLHRRPMGFTAIPWDSRSSRIVLTSSTALGLSP